MPGEKLGRSCEWLPPRFIRRMASGKFVHSTENRLLPLAIVEPGSKTRGITIEAHVSDETATIRSPFSLEGDSLGSLPVWVGQPIKVAKYRPV